MTSPVHISQTMPNKKPEIDLANGGPRSSDKRAGSEDTNHNRNSVRAGRVRINVGGHHFLSTWRTLRKPNCSRLAQLDENDEHYDSETDEFYFDRSATLFDYILDLHRTGMLHIPHDVCTPKILSELEYWDIPQECISPCCWMRIREHHTTVRQVNQVSRSLEEGHLIGIGKAGSTQVVPAKPGDVVQLHPEPVLPTFGKRLRNSIWMLLEAPFSSRFAKIWLVFYLVLVSLSIFVLCAESDANYWMSSEDERYFQANVTCAGMDGWNDTEDAETLIVNHNLRSEIVILEIVTNTVFTVEFLLKCISCPNYHHFILSVMNWFDLISSSCSWILVYSYIVRPCDVGLAVRAINVCAALRSLRTFRVIRAFKVIRGFQIITLALKASIWEICILVGFIFTGMLVFATLIYYAETTNRDTYDSIPSGFWWAIVTMTTVGYGDMYPTTSYGYMIGALCVLTSMFATGLPIPVISTNFNALRHILQLRDDFMDRKTMSIEAKADGNTMFKCPVCRTRVFIDRPGTGDGKDDQATTKC